jgi:large subunit ribosomal protein L14
MKGLAGNQTRGLPLGARLDCIDNSGAKEVSIIAVPRAGAHHKRLQAGGVGDFLTVSVKKGTPEMRRQVVNAVIVRQRRPFRRADGTWVQFEDNAAVIVAPNGETKGSDIKGPVAREAAERWPRIAATASQIV